MFVSSQIITQKSQCCFFGFATYMKTTKKIITISQAFNRQIPKNLFLWHHMHRAEADLETVFNWAFHRRSQLENTISKRSWRPTHHVSVRTPVCLLCSNTNPTATFPHPRNAGTGQKRTAPLTAHTHLRGQKKNTTIVASPSTPWGNGLAFFLPCKICCLNII